MKATHDQQNQYLPTATNLNDNLKNMTISESAKKYVTRIPPMLRGGLPPAAKAEFDRYHKLTPIGAFIARAA